MTVKYNVVERGNPSTPAAPKKHYPSIRSSGRMTLRQLATRIADISTVSSTDTMAVLEALLSIIPQELSEGNIIELGAFGRFWLRSRSAGADAPEDVRSGQFKTVLPRFNPGKEFKKVLGSIDFEKEA